MAIYLDQLPVVLCNHRSPRTSTDLIVVHTNEGGESKNGAEGLAAYLQRIDAGYNVVADCNSAVRTAWDNEKVWGAGGVNSRAWHICLIGYAAQTANEWDDAFSRAEIEIAASLVRQAAVKLGVPLERVTDTRPGNRGICGHVDVSEFYAASDGHSDPGRNFPWVHFMGLVTGVPPVDPPPPPEPLPVPTSTGEKDLMQTIHYPPDGRIHTFWVTDDGRLFRAVQNVDGTMFRGNMMKLSGANEALQPEKGCTAFIGTDLKLHVQAICADGAVLDIHGDGQHFGASVIGRAAA